MIKVDDRWSFERDKWCWTLYETTKGEKKKTKEEIDVVTETYHSTLDQVCRYIVDKEAGAAESVRGIRNLIKDTSKKLAELIKSQREAVHG